MAVSCPPNVELERTQNKAQFGCGVIAASLDLTAYGIRQREIGQ